MGWLNSPWLGKDSNPRPQDHPEASYKSDQHLSPLSHPISPSNRELERFLCMKPSSKYVMLVDGEACLNKQISLVINQLHLHINIIVPSQLCAIHMQSALKGSFIGSANQREKMYRAGPDIWCFQKRTEQQISGQLKASNRCAQLLITNVSQCHSIYHT